MYVERGSKTDTTNRIKKKNGNTIDLSKENGNKMSNANIRILKIKYFLWCWE